MKTDEVRSFRIVTVSPIDVLSLVALRGLERVVRFRAWRSPFDTGE